MGDSTEKLYSSRFKLLNNTGQVLTDDEVAAFCAHEKEVIEELVPDASFLDYVVRKMPQGYFRILVSYREVSIIKYILDPHYGVHEITKSWKQDIRKFSIKALKTTITNGTLLSKKEISFLYKALSQEEIGSPLFFEIMRIAYYLPLEHKDRFVQIARMTSYVRH